MRQRIEEEQHTSQGRTKRLNPTVRGQELHGTSTAARAMQTREKRPMSEQSHHPPRKKKKGKRDTSDGETGQEAQPEKATQEQNDIGKKNMKAPIQLINHEPDTLEQAIEEFTAQEDTLLPEATEQSRAQGKQDPRNTEPAATMEDEESIQTKQNHETKQPDRIERKIEQLLGEEAAQTEAGGGKNRPTAATERPEARTCEEEQAEEGRKAHQPDTIEKIELILEGRSGTDDEARHQREREQSTQGVGISRKMRKRGEGETTENQNHANQDQKQELHRQKNAHRTAKDGIRSVGKYWTHGVYP